jgi:hypothetical protein
MLLKTFAVAAAFLAMAPASAAVIGDFRLDGSLVNHAGGPLTLANNGATLGKTGLTFDRQQGPTITGFNSPTDFSVEFRFSIEKVGGYAKLIDFLDKITDNGLYVHDSKLYFHRNYENPRPLFSANTVYDLVFTRDKVGESRAYVNGTQVLSFKDAPESAVKSKLHLFQDDRSSSEASAGFVDYIRIYDTALTATEVAALTPPASPNGVPEPASWAMMIAGFALAGAAARRRAPGVLA